MNLKETYNKIARDWFRDHDEDNWWIEGTNELVSLLPANSLVLDVGCGAGLKTKYLHNRGLEVVGVDFSEEMIAIAREQVPETEFRVLDLYNIDSLNQKFDCVFAQAVLLHIPKKDISLILQKFKALLKPTGLLYIAVKERRPDSPDEEIRTENDYGYEYKRFFSYFSPEEMEKFVTEAGLTMVRQSVTLSGKTNWIQIIAKL